MWDSPAPAQTCSPAERIEAVSREIKVWSAEFFDLLDKGDAETLKLLAREAEHLTRLFDVLWSECLLGPKVPK